MELLVVLPLVVLAVAVIVRAWWSARSELDPYSSVDSFHRALTAMQPGEGRTGHGSAEDARARREGPGATGDRAE